MELLGLPQTVIEGALVKGKLQLSSRGGPVSGIRLLAAEPDLLLDDSAELAKGAEPDAETNTGRHAPLEAPFGILGKFLVLSLAQNLVHDLMTPLLARSQIK